MAFDIAGDEGAFGQHLQFFPPGIFERLPGQPAADPLPFQGLGHLGVQESQDIGIASVVEMRQLPFDGGLEALFLAIMFDGCAHGENPILKVGNTREMSRPFPLYNSEQVFHKSAPAGGRLVIETFLFRQGVEEYGLAVLQDPKLILGYIAVAQRRDQTLRRLIEGLVGQDEGSPVQGQRRPCAEIAMGADREAPPVAAPARTAARHAAKNAGR